MNNTLYDILGVARDADQATIKRAYRRLMKKYHPDQDPSAEAAVKFKEVRNAYDILGDSVKRQNYDQQLANQRMQSQSQQSYQSQPNQQNSYSQRTQNDNQQQTFAQHYWWTAPIILMAIVLIWTGYHQASKNFSYNAQLNATKKVLAEKNPQQLLTVVKSDNNFTAPVTTKSIMPFYKYLHQNKNQNLNNIDNILQSNQNNISFERTGRQWLFFPKYQIRLAPVTPVVETNQGGVLIKLAGQQFLSKPMTLQKPLKAVLPGVYTATASIKGKMSPQTNEWNAVTAQSGNASSNLNMDVITLKIQSALANGKVFLNDKKVSQLKGSAGTYAFLLSNNIDANKIQVKTRNSQTESKTVSKNDDMQQIALKIQPTTNQVNQANQIASFLTDLIMNMQQTQNGRQPSNGQQTFDYFKNGRKNSDYQSGYRTFINSKGTLDSIEDLKISKENSKGIPVDFKIGYHQNGEKSQKLKIKMILKKRRSQSQGLPYQIVSAGPAKTNQTLAGKSNPDADATTSTHNTSSDSSEPFKMANDKD